MNIIDPPGLTVMRIAGGRYRVTGAHRVVWRWMNKFSPASAFQSSEDVNTASSATNNAAAGGDTNSPDTDFDFGDLVTMTIIDVFETDNDGKLLSYCPTFDNRAVHKTREVTERIRKGAGQFLERMDVVAKSPAGQSVNRAAGNFGKMSINAALTVGNIVKHKIEEEIHKHQKQQQHGGGKPTSDDTSADAVGGADVEEDMIEEREDGEEDELESAVNGPTLEMDPSGDEQSAATPGTSKNFSDYSTAATPATR